MKIIKIIKKWVQILIEPKKEFNRIKNEKFEDTLGEYLRLLITLGIFSGIISLLYNIGKAVYLDLFHTVNINYMNMINFMLGQSTSIIFFYLFGGTFLVFILSIIVRLFANKIKYTTILKIIFYSLTPIILFGWLPFLAWSLLIWVLFLIIVGVSTLKSKDKINKNSIDQRD